MRGLARISFARGALLLPMRNPYDHDVLCEHVDAYARQHGGGECGSGAEAVESLVPERAAPSRVVRQLRTCPRRPRPRVEWSRSLRTLRCDQSMTGPR
jgi:hypothetical protein